MAVVEKIFQIISRFSLFKRAECSSSLLGVEKNFLLRNPSILTSGKLCFLDNTNLSNMSGHTLLSEQQNNCKSTCSLPSFWQIALVTALVFGLSRHKVAHAEPPAKQKSTGRDEKPTDSHVSSFTMDVIDVGYHCHM